MIRRGDVYLAELGPVVGREQSGRRPIVIVSADEVNRSPLVVVAVPGTGAERVQRDYRTNVRVPAAETGLPKDTVFLCFHVRAVDPERFTDKSTGRLRLIGKVPEIRMKQIDAALERVLDLRARRP